MAVSNNHLNVEVWPSWGSRSVECFEKLEQIGEGTYGQVYMAKEKRTGEIVALKKIRMDNEKEGFPITAIREIKILKKLQHENVIKLKEIVTSPGRDSNDQGPPEDNKYKGSIYMVFEYMDHDLTGLADRPGLRFTVPQIKCYMKQLLTGLHYCHVNQVLHRDIKGSNLLIDNEGNLKLADFGLARSFSSDVNANLTNRVITLWYRPPELLLGATKYGPAVDMWSVGCIFAELLNGKPILTGKNEPEQLTKIFDLCGTPDELSWPGVSKIPWYNKFKPSRPMKRRVREQFKHFDRHALDMLEKMLVLDPAQRIAAKDALDAEYFWTDPLPCDPKVCQNTNHHTSSRQRRKDSSKDKTKKLLKDKSCSTLNNTHACLQFSSRATSFPKLERLGTSNEQFPARYPQPSPVWKAAWPSGGPSRYPPGSYYQDRGGQSGGYSSGPYPTQGARGPPPYPGNSGPSNAPRGTGGAYGAPPNYSQSGQYGGGGRGQNPMGGGRNQQYGGGWQQ